ncbi:MAG TPA: styrene monooxygenase/indole monooxygenase family protein [Kofleriaceae bacterium]
MALNAASVGIVGAGIGGLHLGLYLRQHGVAATLYTDRSADAVRTGRLLNTASLGGDTRDRDRALGVAYWDTPDAQVSCIHFDLEQPALRFRGDFARPNLLVDMRHYLPRLLEAFEARGGRVVVQEVDPAQLTEFARDHACLVVASGRSGLSELFPRIPEHSPFREPQRRILAVLCTGIRPSAPPGLTIQVVPGRGELLDFPFLREDGRVGCINVQAIPGGPFEPMARMRHDDDPAAFRAALLALFLAHAPLTRPRIDPGEFDVLGPSHVLQGGITPTVRRGHAALGDGRFAIALGDAHITHDPIGAQGANAASRAAWILGELIVARLAAGRSFDAEFHAQAEQTLWQATRAATEWSNVLLRPPSQRFVDLLVAASRDQTIANAYVDNFTDHPERQLDALRDD